MTNLAIRVAVNLAVELEPEARFEPQRAMRTWDGPNDVISQQNTFTGRLTEEMLDAVFDRAALILDGRAA